MLIILWVEKWWRRWEEEDMGGEEEDMGGEEWEEEEMGGE